MATPIIIVSGFSPTNKVPGFFGVNAWASGKPSANLYRRKVLLVGRMGAGSTATAATVYPIFSEADAVQFGVRSELARMIRVALKEDGVTLYACAVADSGSPTAATATITIGGTWTANWSFRYRLCGQLVTGTIASSDSPTQAAVKIVAAFNADPHLPMVATSSVGAVTLTIDTAGARGNQYVLAQDQLELPSTATSTLAGGTALTGGAVPFTSGAVGTESYTTLLAAISTTQYDRIAVACNDATGLQAWQTHLLSQSGALIGNLEQVVYATNGTLVAAQSLTQTSLNEPLMQGLWFLNSETHPSELAASHAAKRAITEEANPSPRYLNTLVKGAAPQAYRADWPSVTVRDSALNAGVTPLMTTEDGKVVVNRGITTYSKNGSSADFRCLDINNVSMGQYARERVADLWDTVFLPEYDHVRADPGIDDPDVPAGVLTPSFFKNSIIGEQKTWESNGWVIDVDLNPPTVVYDSGARRLMLDMPFVAAPPNYQLGAITRQRSA